MTCIVGIVDSKNKSVTIGADSAAVSGLDVTVRKDPKVFRVGDFVIGGTSSFRMIQLLRFKLDPPKVYDKDIYEYMCTDFVDAVKKCFKDGGYLQKYDEGDSKGGTFLVGWKDRLFVIEDDFQVGESIRGYEAVGCGANYALGAIHAPQIEKDVSEVIISALNAAEYYSAGVIRPFQIGKTK